MPLRAILSTLFILFGTLSGSAAPLNSSTRNAGFQPRSTRNAHVLKPAHDRIFGSEQRRSTFNVRRITPVWQPPTVSKQGRPAFGQPDGAVVRPAVTKAAEGG